jgi:hypothetical protein
VGEWVQGEVNQLYTYYSFVCGNTTKIYYCKGCIEKPLRADKSIHILKADKGKAGFPLQAYRAETYQKTFLNFKIS